MALGRLRQKRLTYRERVFIWAIVIHDFCQPETKSQNPCTASLVHEVGLLSVVKNKIMPNLPVINSLLWGKEEKVQKTYKIQVGASIISQQWKNWCSWVRRKISTEKKTTLFMLPSSPIRESRGKKNWGKACKVKWPCLT